MTYLMRNYKDFDTLWHSRTSVENNILTVHNLYGAAISAVHHQLAKWGSLVVSV